MTSLSDKPDWAPSVWHDDRGNLYAQFGQAVLKFAMTEGGLGKLLRLIPTIASQPGYKPGKSIADQVLKKPIRIARVSRQRETHQKLGGERRTHMHEFLERKGVLSGEEGEPKGKVPKPPKRQPKV